MIEGFPTAGIVLAVSAAALIMLIYTFVTGVAPVPTSPKVRRVMLESVPADFEGPIFELGAGWGNLAFALADRFPHSPVTAYELSPVPWLFSRLRQLLFRRPNLTLLRADFHDARLDEAALIFCFLYPVCMRRLKPKLEAELRPGALLVSNTWPVPGWTALAVHQAEDWHKSKVYQYAGPERSAA